MGEGSLPPIAFWNTRYIRGYWTHQVHIGSFHSNIFRSNVFSPKECMKCANLNISSGFLGLASPKITALPSKVQSCNGRFVGHPTGKTQYVIQRIPLRGVLPHSSAAQCRAQNRIVDTDYCTQSCIFVVTEYNLFVIVKRGLSKYRIHFFF